MPAGGPRIRGFDYRGLHRYSLTICTAGKQTLFIDPHIVHWVLQQIQQQAVANEFKVVAYCFMPDHLHLLVEGSTEASDLQRFVRTWKQRTGFTYGSQTGRRLWQTGFFDHVLRSDESTERHARYILGNPVRAGLAAVIGEYPFAGPCGLAAQLLAWDR